MLSKAQIKYIHALRHKKYRQKYGSFVAEGVKVTAELLAENSIPVESVFATAAWIAAHPELERKHPGMALTAVSEEELGRISGLETAGQVLAVCRLPQPAGPPELKGAFTLMLESIRDPGNLGTIIRIADWFGIREVICSEDCADAFNAKSIQASMGSIARVRVREMDPEDALAAAADLPVFAATLGGRDIRSFPPCRTGLLVIGNESRGLSDKMLRAATERITIPRLGGAESLNAAVAAGILCSHLLLG
jgi:TrmH family RNA methyltransferase